MSVMSGERRELTRRGKEEEKWVLELEMGKGCPARNPVTVLMYQIVYSQALIICSWLTVSTEQSPSREANRSAASQEIPPSPLPRSFPIAFTTAH